MSLTLKIVLATLALPVLVALGGLVVVALSVWREAHRFAPHFAGDARYQATVSLWGSLVVHSRDPRSTLEARPNWSLAEMIVPRWRVTFDGIVLAGRTELAVSDERLSRDLLQRLNVRDVEIGDPSFDEMFKVHATDAHVARAVLSLDTVKAALRALWAQGCRSVVLDGAGRLTVTFRVADEVHDHAVADVVRDRRVGVARAALDSAAALSAALQAADTLSLSPPSSADRVSTVSSSSGAPVGVRGRG